MIKVNLNRSRGDMTAATRIDYQTTVDSSFELEDAGGDGSSAIVKLILIALSTVGLIIFESYTLNELGNQLNQLNVQRNTLEAQIQEQEPIAAQAEILQKEILAIESRIDAIKNLAKERLREIKAIDYIQNTIPERVWLGSMEFGGAALKLEGGALGDEDLNQFIDNLEGKSYFKNVVLMQSLDQRSAGGSFKSFVITSTLISRD